MDKESCFKCSHKEVCWLKREMLDLGGMAASGTDNEIAEKLREMCCMYQTLLPTKSICVLCGDKLRPA